VRLTEHGQEVIKAPVDRVRAFLVDPRQVGPCLPDLQELTVVDDRHFQALVKVGVGAVRGRFKMDVTLERDEADDRFRIGLTGAGMGSALALAATIRLDATDAETTELTWEAEATVNGPLASVGGRLLEAQAQKTTEALFTGIRTRLEEGDERVGVSQP
jgi:carbon monoxide dehydrogenase subunit G